MICATSSVNLGEQCLADPHDLRFAAPPSPKFNRALLTQEPVAIFGAPALPRLLGSETGLDTSLAQILNTVAPSFTVIPQPEAASLINANDLANEYTRMRNEWRRLHRERKADSTLRKCELLAE